MFCEKVKEKCDDVNRHSNEYSECIRYCRQLEIPKFNVGCEYISANNVYCGETLRCAPQMGSDEGVGLIRRAVMMAMNQSELQCNSVMFICQESKNSKDLACHANNFTCSCCFCDLEQIFLNVGIDKIENVQYILSSLMNLNVKVCVFFDMLSILNKDGLKKACVLSECGVSVGISGCIDIDSIYDHIFSSNIFDFIEISLPDNMSDACVYNRLKDKILYLKESFGVETVLNGRGASINALGATACWGIVCCYQCFCGRVVRNKKFLSPIS